MLLKIKFKNHEAKEYQQILTAFTADNENTKDKLLTVVTSNHSEVFNVKDIEDFEIIGCGKC